MNRNWIIIAVILVLVVLGLAYTLAQRGNMAKPQTEQESASIEVTQPTSPPAETSPSAEVAGMMVKITSTGFSPKEMKIKAGETVTWMNEDTAVHTVNSAVHPTHQVYTPLNLGNIPAGGKVSLTFPTAGTYKYHDHLTPTVTGSVIVE